MKKHFLLLFCFIAFSNMLRAQSVHKFTLDPSGFMLDGKPFQIISGEMHPARIPHEYWRQRIKMAKAMGCNTIAAYIFWNYQEIRPGIFDFKTGNHNYSRIHKNLRRRRNVGVIAPGPYVCAEWDFGGLPTYLLKIPDIKVRCADPRYMLPLTRYVNRLAKEVTPLQCVNGGPILMVQIENEYGSYANDKVYLNYLKQLGLPPVSKYLFILLTAQQNQCWMPAVLQVQL